MRLTPTDRKKQILAVALTCARAGGYATITRETIAAAATCSPALVSNYFGTMPQLRRSIMRAAIKDEVLEIVAQGLAASDPNARKAPDELKKRAVALIAA